MPTYQLYLSEGEVHEANTAILDHYQGEAISIGMLASRLIRWWLKNPGSTVRASAIKE